LIKFISIQEAYEKKIRRQKGLKGLKFKCHGSCAYIGEDVSPGCYGCFYSDAYSYGFMLGRDVGLPNVCNRNCVYCFEPHYVRPDFEIPPDWRLSEELKDTIKKHLPLNKHLITTECKMQYYEFTGVCETMLYLPVIKEAMEFLRTEVDIYMGTRGWAKIYTNGILLNLDNILKLKDMGFDEVRVHPGASNFSREVYENMRTAVKHIPTVTVETPSWPPHRQKLFEMLPIIEDIGVKHLDICQIEITNDKQLQKIEEALGDIEIYQAFYPVIDDGGLVEDIMHEVLKKGYSYSVIDCNGFVKQSRSAISIRSYWNMLNRKFPPEWEKQRYERKLK
jgi:sulfatase maturation enzyme AslB (radical SAM superfamily)